MKEFILLFRSAQNGDARPSPEQLQNITKPWQDWMGSIAAQDKLANRGNRLGFGGDAVLTGNVVTDGPYAAVKEILGGYIVVKIADLDDATDLATGCAILIT